MTHATDRTLAEAIAHADYWAKTYGEDRAVFVATGTDRFGRDGVVYVRPPDDAEMIGMRDAGKVTTAYVVRAKAVQS